MGSVDGITYGAQDWAEDPARAGEEAERRIAHVLADRSRTTLFLSDLFALRELPDALGRCTHLEELYIGDAEGPDGVTYRHPNVRELTGWSHLEELTALRHLSLRSTDVADLGPLSGLIALQSLDCSGTDITDLGPLSGLIALQNLTCSGWGIADLGPLSGLTALQSLDCVGTGITDLGPLSGLTALQSLDCAWAGITDLGPLSRLIALQTLTCSGTSITDLGPLSGLIALQTLTCSGTSITDLGPLSGLIALQTLTCSGTSITDLAPLSGLTALQSLTCSGTSITDLAPLSGLTALQSLDCSGTGITDLGPLSGLTALQSLDCAWAGITDLGPLSGLTALQSLDCAGTGITDLAPFSGLTALQNLDCSGTDITDLGPLSGLIALQTLDCRRTDIIDLGSLSGLTALQTLYCSETGIIDLGPLSGLIALQSLDCAKTDITDLGPLSGLTALQSLGCSGTGITDLGPLSGLIALQNVDCSGTGITDLGPLSGLIALQNVDCSGTGITDLGPLSGLTALQSLDCSGTGITDLGPLSGLIALQTLTCSGTGITDLGPLSELIALQTLDISQTGITDLSPLYGLDAIRFVGLRGCRLEAPPYALIWCHSLTWLRAGGAHIPGIPEEILSGDNTGNCLPALRAHLADLGDDPAVLGDVKLSVLGNGRIGKTQICNRLRGLGFEEVADSTHGIVVASAPMAGSEHVFNLWDFGGQDIYHGTHTLFLRSRAIFLLVWTPETDNHDVVRDAASGMVFRNQRLHWWIDYVRRYGSDRSPLIVVQNQIDVTLDQGEHPAVVELRRDWPGMFCRSMGYSARDGTGHPTLLDNLQQAVRRFNPPRIGRGRLAVIRALRHLRDEDAMRAPEDRRHRLITMAAFQALCAEAGGIGDPALFLDFLHNAGEVFWRLGLFQDRIVLDQAWVLDAVYTLFNREACATILHRNGGRFTASLLDLLVWKAAGHSMAEQSLFLDFMVACGICFPIEGPGETGYIAPDFLPERFDHAPLMAMTDPMERCLTIESLSPLLMRNLISAIGGRAGAHGQYWKTGVLFFNETTRSRVLIEQTSAAGWRGEIRIAVDGVDRPAAMDAAVAAIRAEAQRLGISPIDDDHHTRHGGEMTLGPDPAKPVSYYVSYAWDTPETPPEARLTAIVDDLCAAAKQRGIHVQRDRDEIRLGGRISEYMARLARGDRIIIILSDRYLKSRACMQELYEIWLQARADDDAFLARVRIFSHPDAKIWTPADRARLGRYWRELYDEERPLLDDMGGNDRVRHLALKKFAAHVGDILYLVSDSLQPRSLDELLTHSFD